ncbi:MAG: hypothetical protein M3Z97_05580 [Candidatus Dormibacteraeota bacterium]|nr:hypothetical protein [Candidatus Dormibacteraeota bacterium]
MVLAGRHGARSPSAVSAVSPSARSWAAAADLVDADSSVGAGVTTAADGATAMAVTGVAVTAEVTVVETAAAATGKSDARRRAHAG